MQKNKNRIAAIDYGRKRIGLAITDESGKIALPLKTVFAGKKIEETFSNIFKTLNPYLLEIKELVIGYPLLLSGEKGKLAKEVEIFKNSLSKNENIKDIKITLWDERLTSSQAENVLKEKNENLSRKKRQKKVDPIAACIILQSYLNAKNI